MSLNKNTKIWLNYVFGALLSILLLFFIYRQISFQVHRLGNRPWWQGMSPFFLFCGLLMLPVNLMLEAYKWKILAGSAQPVTYRQAFASYLAGIAFSVVTPNRLGEYPGRIVYLRQKNTLRLVSVSILGAVAQLTAVTIFGVAGLIFYNILFPGFWQQIGLYSSMLIGLFFVLAYAFFDAWSGKLEQNKLLKKISVYGQLLKKFTVSEKRTVLLLSALRFVVYNIQYLFLLHWMQVDVPWIDGFFLSALFFWAMAIIPSVALAELGIRGSVSLFLFQHYSENTIGILAAATVLWIINLAIPAVIGSILLIRMKLLK